MARVTIPTIAALEMRVRDLMSRAEDVLGALNDDDLSPEAKRALDALAKSLDNMEEE